MNRDNRKYGRYTVRGEDRRPLSSPSFCLGRKYFEYKITPSLCYSVVHFTRHTIHDPCRLLLYRPRPLLTQDTTFVQITSGRIHQSYGRRANFHEAVSRRKSLELTRLMSRRQSGKRDTWCGMKIRQVFRERRRNLKIKIEFMVTTNLKTILYNTDVFWLDILWNLPKIS